jgi:hypothetical protein
MKYLLTKILLYHLLLSLFTFTVSLSVKNNLNHLDQCAEPDICGLMTVDLSVDRQQFAVQALNVTDISATEETKTIYCICLT